MAAQSKAEQKAAEEHGRLLEESLDKLKKGGKWIVIGVLAFGTAFFVSSNLRGRGAGAEEESSQALFNLQSAAELETVIQQYPNTPQASLAELKAASLLAQERMYEDALKKYDAFLADSLNPLLTTNALVGKAATLEALKKYEEAIATLQPVSNDSYLGPMANSIRHRCLLRLGKTEEAAAIAETINTESSGTYWSALAETSSRLVSESDG